MTVLQNLVEDSSFDSKKRAVATSFKGYLKKWKHAKIPLYLALFIELLSPVRILSLAF